MKQNLWILFILISLKSIACTCALKTLSELQKLEIENAELIFIGEVIEVNKSNSTFKIKVTESLNAEDNEELIYAGKNWEYCHPVITEKGQWIIYGNIKDGILKLNRCGLSRSFAKPTIHAIPPPSPELLSSLNEKEKKALWDKLRKDNLKKGLTELEAEIKALRRIRDEK
ncbi:hypothetical protein [Winogradskyella aurantiaca]|uniref:hypothetical protein n=1 Tax=Winogradskyella aurantiaca TaxID=2219558 RepID=UPI000E1CBD86|nr:hypothetical protein [Winogradskyella aurantiaca]